METIRAKIARHLTDPRSYRLSTLTTGAGMVVDHLITGREDEAEHKLVVLTQLEQDIFNVNGLDHLVYSKIVPAKKPLDKALLHSIRLRESHMIPIDAIIFPAGSQIHLGLDPQASIHTADYAQDRMGDQKYAVFTGPTFVNGVPNNGFWSRHNPNLSVPFEITYLPVNTKGGMAFLDNGTLDLVDDEGVKNHISTEYAGLHALVGTSHYFTMNNDRNQPELGAINGRNNLSYLVKYASGRFGFFVCNRLITRRTMKDTIDATAHRYKEQNYMAVELEYSHAQSVIHSGNVRRSFGTDGFSDRVDHYVVTFP